MEETPHFSNISKKTSYLQCFHYVQSFFEKQRSLILRGKGGQFWWPTIIQRVINLDFSSFAEAQYWKSATIGAYEVHHKTLSDFSVIDEVGDESSDRVDNIKERYSDELLELKIMEKYVVLNSKTARRQTTDERLIHQLFKRHPFTLQMRQALDSSKRLYLATEFGSAGKRYDFISNCTTRSINEEQARIVAAEVLITLESLHGLGIIYRDLKPENVLVGNDGHVRLADFGLSKLTWRIGTGLARRTTSFCGTRKCIAPEMLLGKQYDRCVGM